MTSNQTPTIPRDDTGKDLWLKNFANKLSQYIAKYAISATELADVQQSSITLTYWLNYKNQLDEYNKKLTLYKNELLNGIAPGATPSILPTLPSTGAAPTGTLPGIMVRVRSIVQRIKKHVAYTVADGKDMGIDNDLVLGFDTVSAKPAIRVRLVQGGHPEIVWNKQNLDGIELHVDRGTGYEPLAIDYFPNYTDMSALPAGQAAIWKYKGIYLKRDERIGQWSDEVSITVAG